MPVYNAGAYLRPAVESVLGQTLKDWELIVVDDGSTDGAVDGLATIGDPRIRIIRQKNSGKSVAMNRALAEARGRYYALHDADDIAYPERLERQSAFLDANPDVAGAFCCHDVIVDGRAVAPTYHAKTREECARDIEDELMPAHDPTAMYRMSMVRGIEYAPDLRLAQGVDYILRVGERFPLLVLGECLYSYRVHNESITASKIEQRAGLTAEAFARARQRRGGTYTDEERAATHRRLVDRGVDNNVVSHYCTSVADLVRIGRRREAIGVGLFSLRRGLMNPYNAKPIVYALMPSAIIQLYKSAREHARRK